MASAASLARAWRAVLARGGVGSAGAPARPPTAARRGPASGGAERGAKGGALLGWRPAASLEGSRAAGGARCLVSRVSATVSKRKAVRALRRSPPALAAGGAALAAGLGPPGSGSGFGSGFGSGWGSG